jgi:putative spermidine/putrescine transport system permease protein
VLAVLTLVLLALLLCPILLIVASAFTTTQYMVFPPQGFTLRWFDEVLHSRDYVDAFLYSLGIAATTTIVSTLLGGLVALALVRYRFPGRGAVNALVLSPLILPHVLIGVGLLQWLSMVGLLVGTTSLIAAHVIVSMPYAVRLMAAGLTRLDVSLELSRFRWLVRPFWGRQSYVSSFRSIMSRFQSFSRRLGTSRCRCGCIPESSRCSVPVWRPPRRF